MRFYGFNNGIEAQAYFSNLREGIFTNRVVNVCSRDKECVAYYGGKYHYKDGSADSGIDIIKTMVAIKDIRIEF